MTCECCGGRSVVVGTGRVFVCLCEDELFCRTCNKCAKHCGCLVTAQVLDAPLTEQLAVAKHEARRMGVGI